MARPTFLMVDPAHYEIAYAINPWMSPDVWSADRQALGLAARKAAADLAAALRSADARIEQISGVAGAPDLVFPANAAVVLDGRAILARFRHKERQIEQPIFKRAFGRLVRRGFLREAVELPRGALQEGAGDFIWDSARDLFWAGHGRRSDRAGLEAVSAFFGRTTVALELATDRFYHLDTCFCPLPGGEVLYYPSAFTPDARVAVRDHVPPSQLIEASDEDAARFCVNAVAFGRTIVMARAADRLRATLGERGYRVIEVDLSPFIMSGGGAYCMTLRLDRSRRSDEAAALVTEAAE